MAKSSICGKYTSHLLWYPPLKKRDNERNRTSIRNFIENYERAVRQAQNLARRAAREVWARTSLGRAILTAAHPMRAAVAAIQGASTAMAAMGVIAPTALSTRATSPIVPGRPPS